MDPLNPIVANVLRSAGIHVPDGASDEHVLTLMNEGLQAARRARTAARVERVLGPRVAECIARVQESAERGHQLSTQVLRDADAALVAAVQAATESSGRKFFQGNPSTRPTGRNLIEAVEAIAGFLDQP